jgi:hypothetical protein
MRRGSLNSDSRLLRHLLRCGLDRCYVKTHVTDQVPEQAPRRRGASVGQKMASEDNDPEDQALFRFGLVAGR